MAITGISRGKRGPSHLVRYGQRNLLGLRKTLCGLLVDRNMDVAYVDLTDCSPNVDEGYRCETCWRKQAKRTQDALRRKGVKTKTIKITGCTGCPHVKKSSTGKGNLNFECWYPTQVKTRTWPGTQYPPEKYGRMIAEECEWSNEYPKGFPKWCPL